MRTLTLFSALICILFSTAGILATTSHALADQFSFSRGDATRQYGDDRSRSERSRDDRYRDDRKGGDYRHRDDRKGGVYRRDYDRGYRYPNRSWHPAPNYHYYGRHWYKYPRYYDYPGHRHYFLGNDFLGWLAFTAITLAIIDSLNEQQQREHELALRDALRAPVGETIHWDDADASGSVTVIREGTSSTGRYCREYTQEIRVGGESQHAYGTACRNADGTWEIVN